MMIALSAMLGQVGLPGGGFSFGHGSMNGVGNPRVDTRADHASRRKPGRADVRWRASGDMLLHPAKPSKFAARRGIIGYPFGTGPAATRFHHHQQLNRLVEGWQADTVIVQDIWWTAAAKMADIVLPVTSSLERNDIGGSSRDRYVLAMHQAIAPQHQARNDFDIFADLAERLGYRERFTENRDERVWIEAIYRQCGAAQQRAGVAWPEFEGFLAPGLCRTARAGQKFVFLRRSAPIRRTDRCKRPAAR